MSKTIIKASRKIKCLGNCIDSGEYYLHPITLDLSKNTSNNTMYCPSSFHYDKDGPTYAKACTKNTISSSDIQKFMALPYLNLNIEQMLDIYKINNIESILLWVTNMIEENMPYKYVNRIINIWIKSYYDDLLKNNNILINIYEQINNHYWKKDIDRDQINKYIKYWFKNKNYEDFSFDLGNDMIKNIKI